MVGVSSHTASTLRACNARFLHTASKEGLRVIASGMERAVRDCDLRAGAGKSVKQLASPVIQYLVSFSFLLSPTLLTSNLLSSPFF